MSERRKDMRCLTAYCPTCGTVTAGLWMSAARPQDVAEFYKAAIETGRDVDIVEGPVELGERCTCRFAKEHPLFASEEPSRQ